MKNELEQKIKNLQGKKNTIELKLYQLELELKYIQDNEAELERNAQLTRTYEKISEFFQKTIIPVPFWKFATFEQYLDNPTIDLYIFNIKGQVYSIWYSFADDELSFAKIKYLGYHTEFEIKVDQISDLFLSKLNEIIIENTETESQN